MFITSEESEQLKDGASHKSQLSPDAFTHKYIALLTSPIYQRDEILTEQRTALVCGLLFGDGIDQHLSEL